MRNDTKTIFIELLSRASDVLIMGLFCLPTACWHLLTATYLIFAASHGNTAWLYYVPFKFKAVEVCVAAWKMPETSANVFLELLLNPSSCSS